MKRGLIALATALAPTLGCAASVGGGAAHGFDPGYNDGFVRTNLRFHLPHEYRDFASLELNGQSGYRTHQRADQWRVAGGLGHAWGINGASSPVGFEYALHAGVAVGEQRTNRAITSFLVNTRVAFPLRISPCRRALWKGDEAGAIEFSLVPQLGGDLLLPIESGHMFEASAALFLRASLGVGIAP